MLPPNLACNKYKLLDLAMAKFMFTDYIKVYAGFKGPNVENIDAKSTKVYCLETNRIFRDIFRLPLKKM